MDDQGDAVCALCARPLGDRREKHHLVPRSLGGRETVGVHPICHRKIHSAFTEKELNDDYATIDRLRRHPEIAKFILWVRRRHPDFHKSTRGPRRRR